MSSYDSLDARLSELTRQLNQKDTELAQEIEESIQEDFDALERDIEVTKKDLREGLIQRVQAVKKGIKDRKDELRQRIEEAKKASKDRARKNTENELNLMEEELSIGDLDSAHIHRWIASQWLKASSSRYLYM